MSGNEGMYILAIYICIIYIYRGLTGTKSGGQTPKKIQAPAFLAMLIIRSCHYWQNTVGAMLPLFKKCVGGSHPPCPPFPTPLTYIYLLENSSTSDYLTLTVPNQHNSVDVSSKRKL